MMARLVMRRHDGTFEALDQDGFGYRIWIPAPDDPPTRGIGASVQDAQPLVAGEATGLSGPDPAPGGLEQGRRTLVSKLGLLP